MEPRYNERPRDWQNLFAITWISLYRGSFSYDLVADPGLQLRRGGGHPVPEIRGGPVQNRPLYQGLHYIEVRYIEVPLYGLISYHFEDY